MRTVCLIVVALVTLMFLLSPTHVRQDLASIDAIGGSRKTQTVWRFGFATKPAVIDSQLATRLRALGLRWEPDWRNIKGTYVGLTGRSVGSAHGSAPANYTLAVSPDLQRLYLAKASDDQLREFFRVMTAGTEREQRDAVDAACELALTGPSTTRPDP